MRVTIAPAGAQTCAVAIRNLIKTAPEGTEIHGVYRDLAKVPKEFKDHPSFTATKGSVSDASSLDFTGSNAVLVMTPPIVGAGDPIKFTEEVAENIKKAVEAAGTVKRLVYLSSVGAECDEGTGEVLTNNRAEKILATTDVPEMIFLRAAYFMENWTMSNATTLFTDKPLIYTVLTPLDFELAMVAVEDIGANLAQGLISSYTPPVKPYVFELHGPRSYTSKDAHAAFNEALGTEVTMEAVPPEGLADYFGAFLPPDDVPLFVDMTTSYLPGGVMLSPDKPEIHVVRGKTELKDAIKAAVAALRAA